MAFAKALRAFGERDEVNEAGGDSAVVVGKGKVIPQGTRAEQRTRGGTAASHFSEFSLKRRFNVFGRGLLLFWILPLSFVGGGTYMLVLAGNVAVDDDYWRGCGAE